MQDRQEGPVPAGEPVYYSNSPMRFVESGDDTLGVFKSDVADQVQAELQAPANQTAAVLAPHEQRVVQEARELTERLEKLTQFIAGQVFVTELPEVDRRLLYRQHAAMTELSFVLAARIQRFRPVAADSEGGEV